MKKSSILLALLVLPISVAIADPVVWLDDGVNLYGRTVFVTLPVTNDTGKTFKVDVTSLITSHMIETLKKEKLIVINSPDTAQNSITIKSRLTEYNEGSVSGRWLLPGAGATRCTVRSILSDDVSGEILGEIISSSIVESGGLFSVGAENYVPKSVAKDIAKAISRLTKKK